MNLPSTRTALRVGVLLVVAALVSPAAVSAVTYDPETEPDLEPGTIASPANGSTVISVQGYTFRGNTNPKKPARLISVGERGSLEWIYNSTTGDRGWFYDVDPMPNGNLLVSSPVAQQTVIFELDPDTGERVWETTLDMDDTHDVDYLGGDEFVIANMRAWNESAGRSDDRIVVYNRSTDEITWEWYFRDHFPESTDGGYNDDWSHVNDVDPIGDGKLLLSPRNFDQAVVIDMESGDIVERLGSDDDYDIMNEQHNPDWLLSENGTPTILVADSGNNRVVEYAKEDGEWVQTWSVGENLLNWPRDADRLPNGNTLIVDTLNHRVMEVTPTGEVVWEYYATWGPYDAERVAHGDESSGPTIRDLGASGSYPITGSANLTAGSGESVGFVGQMRATFAGTALEAPMNEFAVRWAHVTPWLRPVWMSGWDFVWVICGALVALVWLTGELALGVRRVIR
ncbi:aryl-sulfate sulfotransferase [Haloferax namakaokahaiae]|uniref:Aryl-sulfate sulfotransferase n=1 Tax=Haloferax namakaokahaiae TaxID=1748331 RepID=A0ABD5ZHM5_9EURY